MEQSQKEAIISHIRKELNYSGQDPVNALIDRITRKKKHDPWFMQRHTGVKNENPKNLVEQPSPQAPPARRTRRAVSNSTDAPSEKIKKKEEEKIFSAKMVSSGQNMANPKPAKVLARSHAFEDSSVMEMYSNPLNAQKQPMMSGHPMHHNGMYQNNMGYCAPSNPLHLKLIPPHLADITSLVQMEEDPLAQTYHLPTTMQMEQLPVHSDLLMESIPTQDSEPMEGMSQMHPMPMMNRLQYSHHPYNGVHMNHGNLPHSGLNNMNPAWNMGMDYDWNNSMEPTTIRNSMWN